MDEHRRLILGIVLLAAALVLLVAVRGLSSPAGREELHYRARCVRAEANAVDGYVSNLSADAYLVSGVVRFSFPNGDSMPRPDIAARADASILPRRTARIASVVPEFPLRPNEACLFDVRDAIRKR